MKAVVADAKILYNEKELFFRGNEDIPNLIIGRFILFLFSSLSIFVLLPYVATVESASQTEMVTVDT